MNNSTNHEEIYIFNPAYDLKLDKNRILLVGGKDSILDKSQLLSFVHPILAVLFSMFDGEKTLKEILRQMAGFLKTDDNTILDLVYPMLENQETIKCKYDGYYFSFPEKIFVKKENGFNPRKFDMKSFLIPKHELDLTSYRLHSPLNANLMINTLCVTNCIYCYANRKKSIDLQTPLPRIKEIIQEAKHLQMRALDITGGEIFLYKEWETLLSELMLNGFVPYISTKVPIRSETASRLKNLGIKRIQISIDSLFKDELAAILHTGEDYYQRIFETIQLLDKLGFEIYTNTQISVVNQDNILQLLNYLLSLKNIKRINMGAIGFSLYTAEGNYLKYRPDIDKVKRIEDHINAIKQQYKERVFLNFSGYNDGNKILADHDEKKKSFSERSRCTANFSAFIILPDGKVTICEELYWHPGFIIGDLTKQSIMEMWTSEKALGLYELSKSRIREESVCKACDEFDSCHRHRGVCWKEILYAYGYDNWDYPDPKCPKAPRPFREYYI